MAIRGILIALIILMSALLVMVFRIMGGSAPVENNPPAEIVLEDSVLDVRTEVFEEATLERIIELAGQTAANRRETIVAQSGGTLSDISVDKGDVVAVGDVIALISADARDENLRQAEQRWSPLKSTSTQPARWSKKASLPATPSLIWKRLTKPRSLPSSRRVIRLTIWKCAPPLPGWLKTASHRWAALSAPATPCSP